jgi:hypothetical protein
MATTVTLPQLNLQRVTPQTLPGGTLYDQIMQDVLRRIGDNFATLEETVNNIINNTGVVNIGFGTSAGAWVIGQGKSAISVFAEQQTFGNECLRLMADGQLVVAWLEFISNSGGNHYAYRMMKAASPYNLWTNLEGTAQEPTEYELPDLSAPAAAQRCPIFVQNTTTGSLLFFYQDIGANTIMAKQFTYSGGNWAAGSSITVVTAAAVAIHLGNAICTSTTILLSGWLNGTDVGRVFAASVTGETVWSQTAQFGGAFNGGQQKRFVDMGDGRVVMLLEGTDPAISGTRSLGWALSRDGGLSFPVGDGTGLQDIGYAGDESGWMFPSTAGTFVTGNFVFSGLAASWSAARIGTTERIGLVYLAENVATSGNRDSGIFYAEFDLETLTWTAQDDHIRLTPHGQGTSSGKLTTTDGSGNSTDISSKAVCATDGVPRAFWLHAYETGLGSDVPVGIHYRRVIDDGDALSDIDWQTQREAIFFGGTRGEQYFSSSQFCGCKEGTVTIGDVDFYPVCWVRRRDAGSALGARMEIMFQLLPLAVLDAP